MKPEDYLPEFSVFVNHKVNKIVDGDGNVWYNAKELADYLQLDYADIMKGCYYGSIVIDDEAYVPFSTFCLWVLHSEVDTACDFIDYLCQKGILKLLQDENYRILSQQFRLN